ncbi:MAG: hypothetical protein ACP5QR_17910, partial [Rhizomicrobium sp.]
TTDFLFNNILVEIGRNFLSIFHKDKVIILRSKYCNSKHEKVFYVHRTSNITTIDEFFAIDSSNDESNHTYLFEAKVRRFLRCKYEEDAEFAAACWDAFKEAPMEFFYDWFGMTQNAV